jgi:3-hydroxymyristoyl/3-hydroxydecanoyl-(acyl carrier protein) dehydratase
LLGRADRIVKLFDERVSLVELEARLAGHPLVEAGAALTLERDGLVRMAAAVVLKEAGARVLRGSGKSAVVALLQTHLRAWFRATALPRTWRFVERLPEDQQGKTSLSALEALFVDTPLSRCATLVQRASESATEMELELEVPRDLYFLRGHFDDFPVVPGVVQLQWAIEWAAEWLGAERNVRGVEALKFKQLLSAGDRFRLRLERTEDSGKLRFRLWNERGEFSSGRLLYALGSA